MVSSEIPLTQVSSQSLPVPVRRKFRLRTTLVLPFLVELVTAVGLVGWLSFQSGQEAVRDLANQLRNEVTARVSDRVRSYVETPQLVNQVNRDAIELGIIDLQKIAEARTYFWRQTITYKNIGYVGFANQQGQYLRVGWINRLSTTETPQIAEQLIPGGGNLNYYEINEKGQRAKLAKSVPNYDVRKRPFYEVAFKAGKPTWSKIYLNFGNPLLQINASLPIYDRNGQPAGILTSQFGTDQIRGFLQTLKIGKTGQVFIVEPSGELVATSLKDQPLWVEQSQKAKKELQRVHALQSNNQLLRSSAEFLYGQFDQLSNIQRDHQFEFWLNNERQFLQISPFKDAYGLNWLIVVVVPESDFMAKINENTRNTIALCFLALLVSVPIGILTARWITQPICRIAQASGEMAKGNLEQTVASSPIIEVDRLADAFNSMATQLQQSFEELEQRVERRTAELRKEKERSELLLLNILPSRVADQLKDSNESPAEQFEEATILFADIVGFTSLAAQLEPLELINCLNQVFSTFDRLAEKHHLEKIKTIGDAYMVVGGVPVPQSNHAESVADMALEMRSSMAHALGPLGERLEIRIGINTGPVIAGVIGTKKFIYDLWGDAVNIASRMESHGVPGSIQVTDSTYERLKDRYHFEERGSIHIKGRGEMNTYWLLDKRSTL